MVWDKRTLFAVATIAGILILLAGGGVLLSGRGESVSPLRPVPAATPATPIELTAAEPVTTPTGTPAPSATSSVPESLKVFVSGAVKKPGVYLLKPGARIEEAVRAAGGFTATAQKDAINLADYARDADQYHIPRMMQEERQPPQHRPILVHGNAPVPTASLRDSDRKPASPGRVLGKAPESAVSTEAAATASSGEETGPPATGQKTAGSDRTVSGKFKKPGDGVVHLNTASFEELQKLPRVGPAMAQRILDYRQQIGKFDDISQLRDVKGIGAKTFEKLQPFLAL